MLTPSKYLGPHKVSACGCNYYRSWLWYKRPSSTGFTCPSSVKQNFKSNAKYFFLQNLENSMQKKFGPIFFVRFLFDFLFFRRNFDGCRFFSVRHLFRFASASASLIMHEICFCNVAIFLHRSFFFVLSPILDLNAATSEGLS